MRTAKAAIGLLAGKDSKIGRSHRGRLLSPAGFVTWAEHHRRTEVPLVWFHAPSVGEGLQALAIIDALRAQGYQGQVAYSYFSPSAETLAARVPAEVTGYLPYDLGSELEPVLQALRPDVLAFTKLDLWPEAACRAAARGTRVLLLAATVRPGSSRLRWPARAILRPGYASLAAAGAISADDAQRLTKLGVDPAIVSVTGDPRFDSVRQVVAGIKPEDPLLRIAAGPTMVAGSTWPDDEQVLLAAFARVTREHSARLVLVPHEPTESHLAQLDRASLAANLEPPARLSNLERHQAGEAPSLVVVDRVGALATIYGGGIMAYVGGAMGSIGLHSVLEPAAWGLPVIVGPRWDYSRDAGLLLAAEGAKALGSQHPVDDLVEIWRGWLTRPGLRQEAGRKALGVVETGSGAADRTAALVLGQLTG